MTIASLTVSNVAMTSPSRVSPHPEFCTGSWKHWIGGIEGSGGEGGGMGGGGGDGGGGGGEGGGLGGEGGGGRRGGGVGGEELSFDSVARGWQVSEGTVPEGSQWRKNPIPRYAL